MAVKVGNKITIEGTEYKVVSVGSWEVICEAVDGRRKYPRVATVERLLKEQKPSRSARASRTAEQPQETELSKREPAGVA
jgi:hypothetical protein